jgi:hypothetical protein
LPKKALENLAHDVRTPHQYLETGEHRDTEIEETVAASLHWRASAAEPWADPGTEKPSRRAMACSLPRPGSDCWDSDEAKDDAKDEATHQLTSFAPEPLDLLSAGRERNLT